MKSVICSSKTDTCPDSCPHKEKHKRTRYCTGPGYCSYRGHKVECRVPYNRRKDE